MHGRDGLSWPFPRLVRAPMKWAGLETPKCVTVHQRVKGALHFASGDDLEIAIYEHLAETYAPPHLTVQSSSLFNVEHWACHIFGQCLFHACF